LLSGLQIHDSGAGLQLGLLQTAGDTLEPMPWGWVTAIFAFGVLLLVCVIVLLRREAEPAPWDSATGQGQHLRHLSRLLRAIRAINSLIVTERQGESLLEKACQLLTATRGYRMAWIGLVNEADRIVHPASRAGYDKGYLDGADVRWDDSPAGNGPTGQSVRTGEPAVMRDIAVAPEFQLWREEALKREYRSCAALPLRFKGSVLGALTVYADTPDAFDIEEVGLLQEVADHLAFALGSIRLESELEQMRSSAEEGHRIWKAFESAPLGVMLTDAHGRVTQANHYMLALLNGSGNADDLLGRIPVGRLPLFDGDEARACAERVLKAGEAVEFDGVTSSADGTERRLRCRGIPLPAGAGGSADGAVWLVEEMPSA
jgi:PAS domain-containing protein